MIALTETHVKHDTFSFPGWTVYASPRKVQRIRGASSGGVSTLLLGFLLSALVRRYEHADGLPPETIALEFLGFISVISVNVAVILSYVTRPGKIKSAYKQKYGTNIASLLPEFIVTLRNNNKQIVLLGDFHAYTVRSIGWSGCDPFWSELDTSIYKRGSACLFFSSFFSRASV